MFKKAVFLLSLTLIGTYGVAAAAQDNVTTTERFENYEEIPPFLLRHLKNHNNIYKESYISSVMRPLRQFGTDGMTVTKDDIRKKEELFSYQMRRDAVRLTIIYDLNFDGIVEIQELKKIFEDGHAPNYRNKKDPETSRRNFINSIMKADRDKNGKLTIKEMADSAKTDKNSGNNQIQILEELLSLDSDGDGVLHATELEALALKAYRTADTDNNGSIDDKELEVSQKIIEPIMKESDGYANLRRQEKKCELPLPDAKQKIMLARVYEGSTSSTASIAGQTIKTDVINLEVGAGKDSLYIVAAASSPIIWNVTGNKERIKNIILEGPTTRPEENSNNNSKNAVSAGVIGVDRDKVKFVSIADCGLKISGSYSEEEQTNSEAVILQSLTGRKADGVINHYNPLTIKISGNSISAVTAEKTSSPKPPDGFDETAWEKHLLFQPGGLMQVKVSEVVSDSSAVAYEVLPGWAGIAKLVGEGKLKQVSNGYQIIEHIPYYPTGLNGALSTTFFLSPDIKPPANRPGHSTVLMKRETP